MSEVKVVAASIVNFLRQQLDGDKLTADSKESLEVGVQCIESAFEVTPTDSAKAVDLLKLVRDQLALKEIPPEIKAEAERLKNEGNNLMKSDKYKDALEQYTKAIQLDSRNAVFYCNRAAAHFKLGDYESSVQDCMSALAIDPDYSKAHGRLGLALTSQNKHREARAAYAKALQLEPDNESYRTNLKVTDEQLAQQSRNPSGVDFGSLLQNPGLMNMATEMLSDPTMQQMINSLMSGGLAANAQANTPPANMNALLEAGQMLAQQLQQANPELVDQLRRQMQNQNPPSNPPQ